MNPILIRATVLEDKGVQSFTSDSGDTIKYRSAVVRLNGEMLRLKVDPAVDLTQHIDSEVELELEIKPKRDLSFNLRVIGVRE